MLQVHDMTVRYGATVALRDFSGEFAAGHITALVGGDGAGKSTLLRALAGQVTATGNYIPPEKKNMGFSSGEVWNALSVQENLDFVTRAFGLSATHAAPRIQELLDLAQLTDFRGRPAGRLSGGMRQKLATIMAMLPRPRLLLLDEPTTGVDPASRQDMWRIMRAAAEEGATVVVSTTYLDEAAQAEQVLFLDQGSVRAAGAPHDIIAAIPGSIWRQPDGAAHEKYSWPRGRQIHLWVPPEGEKPPHVQEIEADLEDSALAFLLNHHREGLDSDGITQGVHKTRQRLLDIQGLTKDYGDFRAVDDVSFHLESGEILGLVGGNGAGKTTLIRMLLGVESVTKGQVKVLSSVPSRRIRRNIGYVGQSGGLQPLLSAKQNLQFAAKIHHRPVPAAAYAAIAQMGKAPVRLLPLGARRVLAYMCATIHNPALLVLDEPTSGMDPLARAALWRELKGAAQRGTGILITTHYLQEAQQADNLIMLDKGRIQAQGDPLRVLAANSN